MKNWTGVVIGFVVGVAGFLLMFKLILLDNIAPEDELAPGIVVFISLLNGLLFGFVGSLIQNYFRNKGGTSTLGDWSNEGYLNQPETQIKIASNEIRIYSVLFSDDDHGNFWSSKQNISEKECYQNQGITQRTLHYSKSIKTISASMEASIVDGIKEQEFVDRINRSFIESSKDKHLHLEYNPAM